MTYSVLSKLTIPAVTSNLEPLSIIGSDAAWSVYAGDAAQSITASTDTIVSFEDTIVSNGIVTQTASGAGHQYTLNYTGLYVVSTTVRFNGVGTGERYAELRSNWGGGDSTISAMSCGSGSTGTTTCTCSWVGAVGVGGKVWTRVWHNIVAGLTLEANWGWKAIYIGLLRKYA